MKKRYLEAAKITKTVGLKGEMRARVLCDSADILTDFDLYLGSGHRAVKVVSAVPAGLDMCRLKIEGVKTVEEAQKLVNQILYIDREDAELPEDTWFIADIIGLPVYDADSDRRYGRVRDILQSGPTDVYILKGDDGRELMFPAVPEVLLKVDIEGERIEIRPLKGLFEDEEIIDAPKNTNEEKL